MTNKDFYAFCRDQRKLHYDPDRRVALSAIYHYMRECGVTKAGVTAYLEHCIQKCAKEGISPDAYRWIGQIFVGTIDWKQEQGGQNNGLGTLSLPRRIEPTETVRDRGDRESGGYSTCGGRDLPSV